MLSARLNLRSGFGGRDLRRPQRHEKTSIALARGRGGVFVVRAGSKKSASKRKAGKAKPGNLSSKNVTLAGRLKAVGATAEGFAPLPAPLVDRGPAVALAYTYLGDAVWELYARQHMILRRATEAAQAARAGTKGVAMRPQEATKRGWCSSIAMHGHLARLLDGDAFTAEEIAILKWGRDYGHESRSGHKKEEHREASALEALVAYWYLFDQQRLHHVLSLLGMTLCGQPLGGLAAKRVRAAAMGAMESLRVDARPEDKEQQTTASSSSAAAESGEEEDDDFFVEILAGDDLVDVADDVLGERGGDDEPDDDLKEENARLRLRVAELEAEVNELKKELNLSKRATRMLRSKGGRL